MPGAVGGYLPPVVAQLGGDATQVIAKLQEVKALLAKFAGTNTQTQLGATLVPLQADLLTAKTQLLQFARMVADAKLGADAAPFWADIAALKTQLAAMSQFDINVDANVAGALAKIAALRGELALMGVTSALAGAGEAAGAGGAAGGAGGAGLLALLGLGNAAGLLSLMHVMHLFMPEIIGVITALSAVVIGFGALGIASIGAATDIMTGFSAVSSAQNAIQAAIPGTTQWATGITNLGQAWSAIPTALQPAVSAINNLMAGFGNTPMAKEIQGFLGAQAGALAHLFSGAGSTFAPLIYAAQQAMITVEGIFSKSLGGGALTGFVDSISKMVGPASVELTQIVIAVMQIGAGFAKAVQDGQGMEVIVNLFQTLATTVNSPLFAAFIAGWVDFDRVISVVLGLVIKGIGIFASLSGQVQGLGLVLGFVVSGLIAVKSATYLLGNVMGIQAAKNFTIFGYSLNSILGKAAGVGLLAVGITGLAGNVATLLHTSNPLTTVWNAIGQAIGFVSHAATGSISTINGYKLQLSAAIPITGQLSNAMDLLVRSEQSIGSSLTSVATGFATFTAGAVSSVTAMVANLQAQNGSIATWAADAQILIKRGMDPSAVASLAQQAPQDLASMTTATTAQLQTMNVQWAEKMMEAKMSGQNGVNAMIAAIKSGLASGSPTLTAAAQALATTLGTALGTPFTGTVASVKSIGTALNALPVSVLQQLAGKTHLYSAAMNDATAKTKAVKSATSGLLGTLGSLATNLIMVGAGLKLMGVWTLAQAAASKVATAAQWLWNVAMDANPIVLIVLAIMGLIAVGVLLITHWKQVTAIARTVWKDVSGFFANLWHDIATGVAGAWTVLSTHFTGLPASILKWIGNVGDILLNVGKSIVQGLINGITGAIGGAVKAIKGLGSSILGGIKGVLGIFSPSSVFAEVGTNVALGLAQGITGGTGAAISATANMARRVTQAGQMGLSSPIGGMSAAGAGGMGNVTISAPISITVAGTTAATPQGIGTAVQQAVDKSMNKVVAQLRGGAYSRPGG